MPNWCSNKLTFIGSEEQIEYAKSTFLDEEGEFTLENIIPMPDGVEDWYHWSIDNWGTKWDIKGRVHYHTYVLNDDHYWTLSFDTAWNPPLPVVDLVSEQFTGVLHYCYDEPGMDFSGIKVWENTDLVEDCEYNCSILNAYSKSEPSEYYNIFFA